MRLRKCLLNSAVAVAVAVAIAQDCAMKCDVTLVEPWIFRFMITLN